MAGIMCNLELIKRVPHVGGQYKKIFFSKNLHENRV